MDTQMVIYGVAGLLVALVLLKLVVKLPLMLLKYGLLALMIYVAYMFFTGRL